MHNYFHFFGRLVDDIEIHESSNSNKTVGTLRIAVKREEQNKNGEYDTDFVKISLIGSMAIQTSKYLKKKDQVLVSGRVQMNKYDLGDDKILNVIELIGEKVTFISSPKM